MRSAFRLATTLAPFSFSSTNFAQIPRTRQLTTSTRVIAHNVVYKADGISSTALTVGQQALPPPQDDIVHIRFLASPINPADINQVEGVYPAKARPIAATDSGVVGGNEGIAEVVAVSNNPQKRGTLCVGDWVVPKLSGFGTWRTHAATPDSELLKISKSDLSVMQAATLSTNPSTAYRMLKDFVNLKEGEYVIQNGANSAVGQAVIQLSKAWGFKTINVIRRPEQADVVNGKKASFEDTSDLLKRLGATQVVAEDDLKNKDLREALKGLPIRLGLNCVGGKATTNMARFLTNGATLVTYGGMSRDPLTFPTSSFIFSDIKLCGFWLTRWIAENPEERVVMLNALASLMRDAKLIVPNIEAVAWRFGNDAEFLENLKIAMKSSGTGGRKQVIVFNNTQAAGN